MPTLRELLNDKRTTIVTPGQAMRSAESILCSELNIGFDRANVLATWKDGVGVLAAFGSKHGIPDLNLAYENPSSVKVLHFMKKLYGAVSHKSVKKALENIGFEKIEYIDLGGNTSSEGVFLDTKKGAVYVFHETSEHFSFG